MNALAGGGTSKTYYAKATATAVGNGKVYVGTSNTAPADEDYQEVSEATNSATSTSNSTNVNLYLYAQPGDATTKLAGWYDNQECTGDAVSKANPFNVKISSNSTNQDSPVTKNYYAKFVEATEFYSSTLTVSCVGEGGTVAVSTASGNEDFGAEKSASRLNNAETTHIYYLQAQVSDAEVYRFIGWYSDATCETEISKNASYSYSVTAESQDETAPTQFHAYAKFEAIPYYYSLVTATALGSGVVSVAIKNNAEVEYDATSEASQKVADKAEHTYYLTAQAEGDETEFDGWFLDEECTEKLADALTYTYTVTSTSLDEASATAFNVYAKFTARNMYQVRNGGFEKWAASNEPGFGWNSFPSAVGNMAQMGKGMSPNPEKVEGRNGGSAVKLISKYAGTMGIGANANGNLTTGIVNMGSMTPTDASNHNFTDTEKAGHFLIIAGQPDGVEFYTKYKKGQSDQNDEYSGHAQFIIHDKYNYRDPEVSEELEHKIGSCGVDIEESEDWVCNTGTFSYDWEKDDAAATTKYLLINFTTNQIPGGSKGDELIIDDVRLIYNSELATAQFNGEALTFTEGAANCDALYDEDALTLTSNGRAATIETSYDDATAVLTITVKGENISNEADNYHTYTVQFKASVNMSVSAAAGYATFVAPFAVTIPEGVTAYTVSAVNNSGVLTLVEVSTEIPANTPVVLESSTDVNTTVTGVVVDGTPTAGLLTGVYADTTAPVGSYVLQNHDGKVGFFFVDDVQPTVKAHRCYLTLPVESQFRALYFEDDITADINSVNVEHATDNRVFDLQGRRISAASQKGMLIVNGKKVIR